MALHVDIGKSRGDLAIEASLCIEVECNLWLVRKGAETVWGNDV